MMQTAQTPNGDSTPKPSRFLTQLAEAAQRHGHSGATADAMAQWCRLFILFHGKKHPQEMGRAEIAADDTAKTETPDVTLRMTNFPPGTVRRGDEHQADLSAVSHYVHESYVPSPGAHRANEHHGQRLLTEEREIG